MSEEAKRIERIIRKHVHDVRNSVNCLDLQAALLSEVTTDPGVAETLRRMRAELTHLVKPVSMAELRHATTSLTSADNLPVSNGWFSNWSDRFNPPTGKKS